MPADLESYGDIERDWERSEGIKRVLERLGDISRVLACCIVWADYGEFFRL